MDASTFQSAMHSCVRRVSHPLRGRKSRKVKATPSTFRWAIEISITFAYRRLYLRGNTWVRVKGTMRGAICEGLQRAGVAWGK
jgi:hypothetical protein